MDASGNTYHHLLKGRWLEGAVAATMTSSSRRIVPEVEIAIERAWRDTLTRPGVRLFDGPVCRLESFEADLGTLRLTLSRTSYRINVGTNFLNPHFADTFGPDVMANPLGVSTGLISSDGYLMLGRRNASVAYYPHRLHPFAGSVEVRKDPGETLDLFDDARRELNEELGLVRDDLDEIECVGIGEDRTLRHPELLFIAQASLGRAAIEARVDGAEHAGCEAIRCDRPALLAAHERDDVTPIGRAVIGRLLEMLGSAGGPDARDLV